MTDKERIEKLSEDLKIAIQTCPLVKECGHKIQYNDNDCIECIIGQILPLIEQSFMEGVKKTTDACDSTYGEMLKEAVRQERAIIGQYIYDTLPGGDIEPSKLIQWLAPIVRKLQEGQSLSSEVKE